MYFMNETKTPSLEQNVFLIFNRQIIPLDKEITRLGRQLDNDIVFNEEFVSRFHAEIRLEDGKYVLYDNESTSLTMSQLCSWAWLPQSDDMDITSLPL